MADGETVIQGSVGTAGNRSQNPTVLRNQGNGAALILFGASDTYGLYVSGQDPGWAGTISASNRGDGVTAVAGGTPGGDPAAAGIRGTSHAIDGVGVYGRHPQRVGVWGDAPIGVVGQSQGDFGIGVEGDAAGENSIGVYGQSTASQGRIGVYATAQPPNAALQVNGRAVFSCSGRIVVPAGATSAAQSGLALSGAALVLATLQRTVPNVFVRAAVVDAAAGTVTVYLNQTSGADVPVGWMAVN